MGALDDARLADVAPLRRLKGKELRDLGRLAHPMVRRRGEPGFTRVSWDEALDLLADRIRATTPDRLAVYLTARGITKDTYDVAQTPTRLLGSNNIDNASRLCHAPSTTTLKKTIGVGARRVFTPTSSAATSSCCSAPTTPTRLRS
jgi:anaerobic selenocysteine-containing dehydrogenase